MIVKACQPSLRQQALEVLVRRLVAHHPRLQEISLEMKWQQIGYKAELEVMYYLRQLPVNDYFILHNIRLRTCSGDFFQMDFVVVTKSGVFIIETKGLTGTVYFHHETGQFIRVKNQQEELFPCPWQQVKRHKALLQERLLKAGIHAPIDCFVTFPPKTKIIEQGGVSGGIVRDEAIATKIDGQPSVTPIHRQEVVQFLLDHDCPYHPKLLDEYNIARSDLIDGVLCTWCSASLVKERARWYCPSCDKAETSALAATIRDYFLLVARAMTTTEIVQFCPQATLRQVRQVLMTYERSGGRKFRSYRPK